MDEFIFTLVACTYFFTIVFLSIGVLGGVLSTGLLLALLIGNIASAMGLISRV